MQTLVRRILPLAISALVVALPVAAAAQAGEYDFPPHSDAGHHASYSLDTGQADTRTDDADTRDTAPESDATTGCPSLGDSCGRAADSCGPASDGCMHKTNGDRVCTCSCRNDRDCGPDGTCISVDGGSWCLPYASPDDSSKADDASCPETACGPDETCRDGECATSNQEPTVVVFHDAAADPDSACSLPGDQMPAPGPLTGLLAAFGLAIARRG